MPPIPCLAEIHVAEGPQILVWHGRSEMQLENLVVVVSPLQGSGLK